MLKIRFQRVGRKHEPVFRLVLVDSHEGPKTGNVKEVLGSYDSRRGEKAEFRTDRIKHWIGLGAKVSDTVHNMLISNKIVEGKKINALPKKKPILKEKTEAELKAEAKLEKSAEETLPEQAPEIVEEIKPEEAPAPVEETKEETQAVAEPVETAVSEPAEVEVAEKVEGEIKG